MLELCVSLTSNNECSFDPVVVTIEAENSRNGKMVNVGKATLAYVSWATWMCGYGRL